MGGVIPHLLPVALTAVGSEAVVKLVVGPIVCGSFVFGPCFVLHQLVCFLVFRFSC